MAETEGGKTGTGRPGQYNLTGVGGVGNMRSYSGYKASIRDTAQNLGSSRYKGKSLAQQTAMWVSGGQPSAKTRPYTNTVSGFINTLGGPSVPTAPGGPMRTPRRPGRPATPGIPGVPGTTLPNPTALLQSLGDIAGTPWTLQLPDVHLPAIPGVPGQKGQPAKRGKLIPQVPGQPQQIYQLLQAAQTATRLSPGYSKATSRGPLKSVSYKSKLDCSLSVAKVLQDAGLGFGPNQSAPVSGWMAQHWGKPGKGKYLTMYASNEHVFLEFKIGGKFYRFDTSAWSAKDQRSGPRLRNTQRDLSGFTARHWPNL